MASLVFVDKENGEFATTLAPKNRVSLSGPVKLGEKVLQVPGKVLGMTHPQSARKALGTVNLISSTRPGVAGNEKKSTAATNNTKCQPCLVRAKLLCLYSDIRSNSPKMATMIFVDKENGELGTTVGPKNRTRLLSAPANTFGEKVLQTPRPGKVFGMAKPLSARKALGTVNKISSVGPDVSGNKLKSKVAAKPTGKVKVCMPVKERQEYPEIEKFIPYNPVEFESFDVPEDQRLSHLCLAGLAAPAAKEELDSFSVLHSCMKLSPLKSQKVQCEEQEDYLNCTVQCEEQEDYLNCTVQCEEQEDYLNCTVQCEEQEDYLNCTVQCEEQEDYLNCTVQCEEQEDDLNCTVQCEEQEDDLNCTVQCEEQEDDLNCTVQCEEQEDDLNCTVQCEEQEDDLNCTVQCEEQEDDLNCTVQCEGQEDDLNCTVQCEEQEDDLNCTVQCEEQEDDLNCTVQCEEQKDDLNCTVQSEE
ncbi:UNVERIFIED_CONTAM: hypothetical protein FKN15_026867 [Acipenser sinensis]